jgi:nucleotide-binding universal stress UspA family protein
MPVKTILLPLAGAPAPEPVLETALRVARRFSAHLDVLYVRPNPHRLLPYATLGLSKHMRESVLESAEQNADTQAEKALSQFNAVCERAGIPVVEKRGDHDAATASWKVETGEEAAILARRGRLSDLIVLAGPIPVSPPPEEAAAALKSTGRPVLIVPADFKPIGPRHVGIGWNGSAESARAVAAAMEYLHAAERVTIFSGTAHPEKRPTAEALVEYLGWHGVEAAVRIFEAHDPGIGESLLAEARAAELNLLVVGGYSRSRLRELMFGGVTGYLLAESDIPVFMVH